jgi:hypothetical protein
MSTKACSWEERLLQLAEFKTREGHCNIPTDFENGSGLGRWAAAQRYKRNVGELSKGQIEQLDRVGFVWVPSDWRWEKMLKDLQEYRQKHGDCCVPERWAKNQRLANWVQTQRHKRRKNMLPADKIHRLDALGFRWAIYKTEDEMDVAPTPRAPDPEEPASSSGQQRLYSIRNGLYVQFNGKGKPPEVLARFLKDHGGEFPPYIPLPKGKTTFHLGETFADRRIPWNGASALPEKVLAYVTRKGTLPHYD